MSFKNICGTNNKVDVTANNNNNNNNNNNMDTDDELQPIVLSDLGDRDFTIPGEHIIPTRPSTSASSDPLEDDRSTNTSDRGTSVTDGSLDANLLDLARVGEAKKLKAYLDELHKKYEDNIKRFEVGNLIILLLV